jgi:hypothetical protein
MDTKNYKFGKGDTGAIAKHVTSPDEQQQAVGIGNLRVLILPDGKFWFAQGLEIDYGAQGSTMEEAKEHFEEGISGTIQLHLQRYGNIEKLLRVSRPEVWKEAIANSGNVEEFTQVSFHTITPENAALIPYGNVEYYIPKKAA